MRSGNFTILTFHATCIAVPADAPTNVSVIAISPFAIAIRWSPPSTPNGIIVSYTLYISSSSVTTTRNQQLMDIVMEGLAPYERVSVRVSASTKIGEGPQSEPVIVYTQETSKSTFTKDLKAVIPEPDYNTSNTYITYGSLCEKITWSDDNIIYVFFPYSSF